MMCTVLQVQKLVPRGVGSISRTCLYHMILSLDSHATHKNNSHILNHRSVLRSKLLSTCMGAHEASEICGPCFLRPAGASLHVSSAISMPGAAVVNSRQVSSDIAGATEFAQETEQLALHP